MKRNFVHMFVHMSVGVFGLAIFSFTASACGQEPEVELQRSESSVAEVSDVPETVFSVDGVDVVTENDLYVLPDVASKVEFTSMIIESGSGPEICVGGVLESLPPQCSGPVVEGLEMGDWDETVSDVSFGERTVVVSWPPVGGQVSLFSDREPGERVDINEYTFPLPAACEDLDPQNTVDVEVLSIWADNNPQIAGLAYFSRDESAPVEEESESATADEIEMIQPVGVGVLQVVEGNMEEAREALIDGDKIPCLVEVENSMQDLEEAREQLHNGKLGESVYTTGNSIGRSSNRFEVSVAVADIATVKEIANTLDNKSLLKVEGAARILE